MPMAVTSVNSDVGILIEADETTVLSSTRRAALFIAVLLHDFPLARKIC